MFIIFYFFVFVLLILYACWNLCKPYSLVISYHWSRYSKLCLVEKGGMRGKLTSSCPLFFFPSPRGEHPLVPRIFHDAPALFGGTSEKSRLVLSQSRFCALVCRSSSVVMIILLSSLSADVSLFYIFHVFSYNYRFLLHIISKSWYTRVGDKNKPKGGNVYVLSNF